MENVIKYLDAEGISYLWKQLSLEDYPNNETLIAILNAIDENKMDKENPTGTGDLKMSGSIYAADKKLISEEAVELKFSALETVLQEI